MEIYQIQIVSLCNGIEAYINIQADEKETTDDIILQTTIDGRELTASHCHYFIAFQNLRDQLLKLGWGMKCNGARENAVASPMMASVDKVYLVTSGEKARMKDVVRLFDYADLREFPNTSRQDHFFRQWGQSLSAPK